MQYLVELLQATVSGCVWWVWHLLLAAHVISLQDVHDRLVYGSDYPVPAINLVIHTSKMRRYSLLWLFVALPCAYSPSFSFPPPQPWSHNITRVCGAE